MATTAVSDVQQTTLISLSSEERQKILLESMREGFPSIPKVSRPVSSRVSRYVSQFTSGRWRERIWFSDESVDSEDLQGEMSTSEAEDPQLVIFGYNLHCEEYLKEREMMARWNIIERELHFPDLEKGYVQKRDAKTQSDIGVLESNIQTPTMQDDNIVKETPTTDVPMEECKESPKNVSEDTEPSLNVSEQGSTGGSEELRSKVEKMEDGNEIIEEESSCSVQESKSQGSDSKAPGASSTQHESVDENSDESSATLEDKESQEKRTTVPEDSEVVEKTGTETKTPEVISPLETPLKRQSISHSESSVSKDVKEVSTVPNPKFADGTKTETHDATSAESGTKISDSNSKSPAILEVMKSVDKMEATAIPEDSSVASSAKVLETSKTTSTGEKSASNTESSNVPEVKELADKMDTETEPEDPKVARTSETDAEASGTNLRGKRKADSMSEDDPEEKRTKKTTTE